MRTASGSLLVLLLAPGLISAQNGWTDPLAARVRERILETMETTGAVGLAVGLVRDGEVVFEEGFGWADREAQVPVTAQTRFRWASISKCLTAMAALQQWERGWVALDADVRPTLPELGTGPALTLRQLLTNTAGVGHYGELDRLDPAWRTRIGAYPSERPFDARAAVAIFGSVPLARPPGSSYLYSTMGFVVAGAVVDQTARAHDVPGYVAWVAQHISQPMGLTTLRPDYPFEDIPQRARGYLRRNGEVLPEGAEGEANVVWKLPGGGFHSTIGDLARFGRGMILGTGLRSTTWELAWSHTDIPNGGPGYGYGFGFRGQPSDPAGRVISHSGAQSRTRTLLWVRPADRTAVALMTNSTWVDGAKDLRPLAEALTRLIAPAKTSAGQ